MFLFRVVRSRLRFSESQLCEWLVSSGTCDSDVTHIEHWVKRLGEHPEGIMTRAFVPKPVAPTTIVAVESTEGKNEEVTVETQSSPTLEAPEPPKDTLCFKVSLNCVAVFNY